MAKKKDRPCSKCGEMMWLDSRNSTHEAGTQTCRKCRRVRNDHVCVGCGDTFNRLVEKAKRDNRRYCSVACRWKDRRATDKFNQNWTPKRRAEYHHVEYEAVNRRKVFERDRWRCGICGMKVNKLLKGPHPMSPSLDHVIPMSRGGGHTYANTQCSHLQCNVIKNAGGGGEQLAIC